MCAILSRPARLQPVRAQPRSNHGGTEAYRISGAESNRRQADFQGGADQFTLNAKTRVVAPVSVAGWEAIANSKSNHLALVARRDRSAECAPGEPSSPDRTIQPNCADCPYLAGGGGANVMP